MKKIYFLLAGMLIISIAADAQYRINKIMYDYHDFSYVKGDPYRPAIAGFSSLLVPGTGQIMCGEVGRGIAILGGFIGSGAITVAGFGYFMGSFPKTEQGTVKAGQTLAGLGIATAGFFCFIYTDIWSAVDASRVAKVNDRAFRYRKNTSGIINIQPYLNTSNYVINEKIPVGLSLKITF